MASSEISRLKTAKALDRLCAKLEQRREENSVLLGKNDLSKSERTRLKKENKILDTQIIKARVARREIQS